MGYNITNTNTDESGLIPIVRPHPLIYALARYYPAYKHLNDRISKWVLKIKNGDIAISTAMGVYAQRKVSKVFEFDGVMRCLGHDELVVGKNSQQGLDYFCLGLCAAAGKPYYKGFLRKKRNTGKFSDGLSMGERERDLRDNYYFKSIPCKKLLIVDDITTTSTTFRSVDIAFKKKRNLDGKLVYLAIAKSVGRFEGDSQIDFDYDQFQLDMKYYSENQNKISRLRLDDSLNAEDDSEENKIPEYLFIFDLDQTLVDSSSALNDRQNGDWDRAHSKIEGFKLFEDIRSMLDLIENLKKSSDFTLKYAVVSSFPKSYCQKVLEQFNISPDVVITHSDTDKHKPSPDPYLEAIKQSNIEHIDDNVIAIGDSAEDIIAAKKCGILSIGATWGAKSEAKSDYANPRHIFFNPRALIYFIKDHLQLDVEA